MRSLRTVFALSAVIALAFVAGWLGGAVNAQTPAPVPLTYELRTYTTLPGKLPNLHARFRDHTMTLFAKHGMKNVVYLTPSEGEKKDNTLVYLLAHESKAAAEKSFAAFRSDPAWTKAREESEKDGKIVEKVESVFFTPTDYSPMK
ncbi:MAG: NIPSNAP family protein [Planctomycetaceae bacterium]|nr:NIPSNAP family protein [Planctomycetaceae bacterium]